MATNRVKALILKSFDSAGLSGTYQAISATGTEAPCFFLRIVNNSNTSITISYDGTNDNEFLLATSSLEIASQTNSIPAGRIALFPIGQKVYVKGSAGVGLIYLSGYYQPVGE
jgi:hypothetical protein